MRYCWKTNKQKGIGVPKKDESSQDRGKKSNQVPRSWKERSGGWQMTLMRRYRRWYKSVPWLSETCVEVKLFACKRRQENAVPGSLGKGKG